MSLPSDHIDSLGIRQKKSMSWLDISVWLKEQGSFLVGTFIDNVYIHSKSLALLRLKKSGDRIYRYLIIEPGKRVSLLDTQINLSVSKALTEVWRKHVKNCKIVNVNQYDRERIIIFTLMCGGEDKNLIIELLPRGTMVLTTSAMEIEIVLERKKMKDRVLAPKQPYKFPPKLWELNIENINVEEVMKETMGKRQGIVSYLVKMFGLPPEVVEASLCACDGMVSNSNYVDISTVKCLITNMKGMLEKAVESPKPCIIYIRNMPIGFYPFIPLHLTKFHEVKVEAFQTFNEAINKYFAHDIEELVQRERIGSLTEDIEKLRHALQDMGKRLQEYEDKYVQLLSILKAFEEHYPELEEVHKCVQRVVKDKGWDNVSLCSNSITGFDKSSGKYYVIVGSANVELDVRKSLVEIYSSYRKMLSDTDRDIKRIESEMKRLRGEIDKMMSVIEDEKKSIKLMLHRSREWYEKFHWITTLSGFLVLGGRDAQQNVYLIKKFLENEDIVLHADIHGGSAVIIKTSGRNVDDTSLREAALLAACYSKAWKLGLHTIDVFWVKGSQISLSPPSGQYLPRGGFMVYGKKNYIHNVVLELAIGVEVLKSEVGCYIRAVVGSQDSIAKKCEAYFVIEPGDMKVDEVIARFLNELSRRGLDFIAKAIDVNELRIKIPGKSRIVKIVINEKIKKVLEEC